jgi:hypothetical protein
VANAIRECAFQTSSLPVILSLEMHCGLKQQRVIAQVLQDALVNALVSVRCPF